MNINNGIIKSSGISLGNLELASEYLYGDSTLYEPELTDIKQHINTNTDIKEPTRKEISIENTDIDERFQIDLTLDIESREYITGGIDEKYGIDIWNTDGNSDEVELSKTKDISITNKDKNNAETGNRQEAKIPDNQTHTVETSNKDTQYETLEFSQSEIDYEDESEEFELYDLDYDTEYAEKHKTEVKTNVSIENSEDLDHNSIESYKENNSNSYNKTSYNSVEAQTKNKVNKKEDNWNNTTSLSIDSLIHKAEGRKKVDSEQYNSNGVNYSELEVDKLAEYMRQFLKCNGVSTGPVDIGTVTNEFGSYNVNRLLTKCYIIKIGKGVTIGI